MKAIIILRYAAALAVTGCAVSTRAQALQFQPTTIEKAAPLGERFITFEFPFWNAGNRAIKIEGAEISCSCMSYEFDKMLIPPRGSALVKMSVDLRGKTAKRYVESMIIKTDENLAKQYVVTGVVVMPGTVTVDQRVLKWKIGEMPKPLRVRVTVAGAVGTAPPKLQSILVSNPAFSAQSTVDSEGNIWLEIAPEDTASAISCVIKPLFGKADDAEQIPEIFAYVGR